MDVADEKQEYTHKEKSHVFETIDKPDVHLNDKEEKHMYRKIDLRLLWILALLYLVAFLDRGNIGNARLAGLQDDLNMTDGEYALALSIFFVSYNLCEVPANLMMKKLRPRVWLSLIVTLFGITMVGMGLIETYGGLIAMRVLLGVFEAGLFPGAAYLLSLWYPRSLLQFRIAIFFSAATIAGAFSGLLAYGIQFMSGTSGYNGWNWIFILEGIFTTCCGALSYFFLEDYPESERTGKFLTPQEQKWVVWRKATDGTMHGEHTGMNWTLIWSGIFNWQTLTATGFYFSIVTPLYSVGLTLPTLINGFGQFSRPEVQLLTVPIYIVACIWVLVSSIWADKIQKRFIFLLADQILCVIGFIMNITPAPYGVKYAGLFLVAMGGYGALPTVVAWLSINLKGQTKRAVGVSFEIGMGNFGGLVASNIYRQTNGGRYFIGHGTNLGLLAVGIPLACFYAWRLSSINKSRDEWQARQDALPEHEKEQFTIEELHNLGDRAPQFRYTI